MIRGTLSLILGVTLTASVALADPPVNAALVTQLAGTATAKSGDGAAVALKAFQKVQTDTVVTLEAGATLRLVYYQAGRKERWTGPAALVIGPTASAKRSGSDPEVTQMPGRSGPALARGSGLLHRAGVTRLGTGRVRTHTAWTTEEELRPRGKEVLAEARKAYAKMRAGAAKDDLTPEVYMIGVLYDLRLKTSLLAFLAEAQKRFPKHEGLLRLDKHLRAEDKKPAADPKKPTAPADPAPAPKK